MTDAHDVLLGWVDKFQAELDALAKPLQELLRPGGKGRQIFETLVRELPNIEARLARIPAAAQQSFKKAGFPPCRLLSIDDMEEIERVLAADGVEAAAVVVERLCREVVTSPGGRARMLTDWGANPVTAPRIDILTAAIKAHEEGRYVLSIPPLLAQLEGTIADGMQPHGGGMSHPKMKEYVARLAAGDELMGAGISDFVNDIVMATFFRGQSIPELSRHAILHGAATSYGTELNSIKIILTFDYVQDLLKPEQPGT